MRAHHAIFVIAALLIGFGVKQHFLPPEAAEADIHAVPSAGMNVLQMHIDHPSENLPIQHIRDMTFVFDPEQ
jgi:hypothetical protein